MRKFLDRAKVVLGSFVTYVVLGSAVVSTVVAELDPYAHIGPVAVAIKVGVAAVSVATAAVAIIRKVTQVVDQHVGLLPVDHFYEDHVPFGEPPSPN